MGRIRRSAFVLLRWGWRRWSQHPTTIVARMNAESMVRPGRTTGREDLQVTPVAVLAEAVAQIVPASNGYANSETHANTRSSKILTLDWAMWRRLILTKIWAWCRMPRERGWFIKPKRGSNPVDKWVGHHHDSLWRGNTAIAHHWGLTWMIRRWRRKGKVRSARARVEFLRMRNLSLVKLCLGCIGVK